MADPYEVQCVETFRQRGAKGELVTDSHLIPEDSAERLGPAALIHQETAK